MFTDAKALTILFTAFIAGTSFVNAHGHVAQWTIGGETKPGFNPSNPPQYGATAERPTDNSDQGFADYTSTIVACGGASAGSGLETWDVNAGDSITATWNTWPESHAGPITEYMAACPSAGCDGVDASTLKWFKIQEDLFDGTKWPGAALASNLDFTFKIPSDLAAGPYLIRHDVLAMHSTGAPQVYPVCIQANLISSGSAVPTDTTTFPAAYDINDDFKTWNLYGGDQSAFVNAGPAIYVGGSSPAPAPTTAAPETPADTTAAPETPAESTVAPETPAESSAAPIESSVEATSDAPVPTTTADASIPEESFPAGPEESAAPTTTDAEVPVETPGTEGPSATSAAPSAAPTSETPGSVELGGAVPPITQNGNRWNTLGGSYFDEASAVQAACMEQMNRCKRWANGLPNFEVSAALNMCDAQESTCESSGASQKRAVIMERYAKRALRFF